MPLAFESASHGTIAFGFFNIETDMLLLGELFFFTDRFCSALVAYVDRGGYPRWRDEQRPPYVCAMLQRLTAASSGARLLGGA